MPDKWLVTVALVALIGSLALMRRSARSHSRLGTEHRMLTELSSEASGTHAHGLDALALDHVHTLAAILTHHVALLALRLAHGILRIALALAVHTVTARLGAAHVATLVDELLAVHALVVLVALAAVATRAARQRIRYAHRMVHATVADALRMHWQLTVFTLESLGTLAKVVFRFGKANTTVLTRTQLLAVVDKLAAVLSTITLRAISTLIVVALLAT